MHNDTPYHEPRLLQLIAAGDEAAFSILFEHHYKKVYAVAFRILKSAPAAEDVLQDVFLKIWKHRMKLPSIDDFNAYLNVMIRNHVFNLLRKKSNEQLFLKELLIADTRGEQQTYDAVMMHELERNLQEAVSMLPPQQKKVFQLSRMHGLRQEEIAAYMKISLGTVKKHMVMSLRFVRNYLSAERRVIILLFWMVQFL